MLLTIFTPTYNRGYILRKLYESLLKQTNSNFEWVVVDDGSTDDTEELVKMFIKENKIPIIYEKQHNGGKHRAINKGLNIARGDLFFIVDSDDYLTNDAIESILNFYEEAKSWQDFCGLIFNNIYEDGSCVGGKTFEDRLYCSLFDFRFKYKIKGDKAEIYVTRILRNFLFPDIPNEYFCPEALVMNRIADQYKMLYVNKGIYVCEYLPDGLTAKIIKIRMKSPQYSTIYYKELFYYNIPFIQKLKAAINFWRFSFCLPPHTRKNSLPGWTIILLPVSLYMYSRDKISTS